MMRPVRSARMVLAAAATVAMSALATGTSFANDATFLAPDATASLVASTVPANGDVNPYGVAVVPRGTGRLARGSVLVSNFNAASNLQGTGTTIVQISPTGAVSLFARIDAARLPGPCPGGIGLTTALVVLRSGWVVVGSLPTSDGTAATAKAGCLLLLDNQGRVRKTLSGNGINGPWDMTAVDNGASADLFVTNVLNGTVAAGGAVVTRGTVLRLRLTIDPYGVPNLASTATIGSGFAEKTDPNALVVGPTGVALGRDGSLFVADSVNSRITAIPNALGRYDSAGTGRVVSSGGHLATPLGLAVVPTGDILTANGGDGNIVETTPAGQQVAVVTATPGGAGALFGLAVVPTSRGVYFVDDSVNTLNLLS